MLKTKSNQNNLSKVMDDLVSKLKESKISCDEFIDRTVQTFEELNPDQTYITWSVEDVQKLDKKLSKKEAQKILKTAGHKHDASVGINWDVLKAHIDYH